MVVKTIKSWAEYYKAQDPNTPLTETMLRKLVKEGKIYSARAGVKYLVTDEAIECFLRGETQPSANVRGAVRRVEV